MRLTKMQLAAVARGERVRVTIDGVECAIVRWDDPRPTGTGPTDAGRGSVAAETARSPSFWRSPSLDDLARSQGVTTAADLDAISDLWPVDDDPDDFLEDLLAERALRRSAEDSNERPGSC